MARNNSFEYLYAIHVTKKKKIKLNSLNEIILF